MAIKRKVPTDTPLTVTQSRTKRKIHHQVLRPLPSTSMALPGSGADDDHYSSGDDGDYVPPDPSRADEDDTMGAGGDEDTSNLDDSSNDEDDENEVLQRPLKGMSLDFSIFTDQFNEYYEGRQEVIRTARTRAQAQALRVEMLTSRSTDLRTQLSIKNRDLQDRRDE
ncbi:hypothetical protein SeMB42_g01614, partial [Synchytrium endobioticum]